MLDLKSAIALADGTVVGFEELVNDPTVWSRFLAVPEETGAYVVLLVENTVLMSASAPRTRRIYEARGPHVVAVDMTEFETAESPACPGASRLTQADQARRRCRGRPTLVRQGSRGKTVKQIATMLTASPTQRFAPPDFSKTGI